MIKNCAVCNKEFKTYQCKINEGKGKYCSVECARLVTNEILANNGQKNRFKKGDKPHNFKGESLTISRNNSGYYKYIYKPEHPYATKKGYVREHRLIMEEHLGRLLLKNEIVHHINENTLDNRVENLQVMDKKEHDRMNVGLNIHKRYARV